MYVLTKNIVKLPLLKNIQILSYEHTLSSITIRYIRSQTSLKVSKNRSFPPDSINKFPIFTYLLTFTITQHQKEKLLTNPLWIESTLFTQPINLRNPCYYWLLLFPFTDRNMKPAQANELGSSNNSPGNTILRTNQPN